ncbi:acyltransferase family protein [Pseudovibrio exalbescens]|uniref:acyltransferase family protein n=1 Tax=Pseudovibrio exalbescens TaxID=197461 RepID=UPI0023656CC1|nr:acyltransferase family protein [Pseudovibrio exalbescens]MDD7908969.1 acyltransferase family protein [Pseudovibrio exalbescens]
MFNRASQGFRPDIEGLRGLAVLLVILFHFNLLGLQAGFIGVDVFFVISGFLMTQIILNPKFEWNRSGILSFYRKRFWRLAPSYYVVLLAILGLIYAFPWQFDFDKLSTGLLYSTIYAYNIVAPSDTGYFGTEAINNPILHLWSLGVEVQFYLVWPIVLLLIKGKSYRTKIISLVAITVISLILSQVLVIKDPEVAYFLLFSRLWQFCFGALAALLITKEGLRFPKRTKTLVQTISLTFIVGSAWIAPKTEWPSIYATIPTIATATIIIFGSSQATNSASALSLPPLRWLGKISYSLYLIHWPMVVLGNATFETYNENTAIRIGFVVASLFVSVLLFHLIEKRMRALGLRETKLGFLAAPACAATIVISGAVVLKYEQLNSAILNDKFVELKRLESAYYEVRQNSCHNGDRKPCLFGDIESDKTVLVWGDSHARHLLYGLNQKFKSERIKGVLFESPACAPLIGTTRTGSAMDSRTCSANNTSAFDYVKSKKDIYLIVLAARWSLYSSNNGLLYDDKNKREVPNFLAALQDTITDLNSFGHKVLFVTQAPQFPSSKEHKKCKLAYIVSKNDLEPSQCQISAQSIKKQLSLDHIISEEFIDSRNNKILDLKDAFCSGSKCFAIHEGTPLYHDYNHLNTVGSEYAAEKLFSGI